MHCSGRDDIDIASHIANQILQKYQVLTDFAAKPPRHITFQWAPAHLGIPGNKKADSFTKEASLGTSSPPNKLPHYLRKPLVLRTSQALLPSTTLMYLKIGTVPYGKLPQGQHTWSCTTQIIKTLAFFTLSQLIGFSTSQTIIQF